MRMRRPLPVLAVALRLRPAVLAFPRSCKMRSRPTTTRSFNGCQCWNSSVVSPRWVSTFLKPSRSTSCSRCSGATWPRVLRRSSCLYMRRACTCRCRWKWCSIRRRAILLRRVMAGSMMGSPSAARHLLFLPSCGSCRRLPQLRARAVPVPHLPRPWLPRVAVAGSIRSGMSHSLSHRKNLRLSTGTSGSEAARESRLERGRRRPKRLGCHVCSGACLSPKTSVRAALFADDSCVRESNSCMHHALCLSPRLRWLG
mmetsp:Transcript_15444/g.33519  ORF Transcript_15444/g.33519 Transcript_15444/m.33519 type:complete len:256 (+) Transcript_15444:182-949(+)